MEICIQGGYGWLLSGTGPDTDDRQDWPARENWAKMQLQQRPQLTPQGTLELVESWVSQVETRGWTYVPLRGPVTGCGLNLGHRPLGSCRSKSFCPEGGSGWCTQHPLHMSIFMSKDVFPTCPFTSPWLELHLISISKPFIGNGNGDTRIAFDWKRVILGITLVSPEGWSCSEGGE